MVDLLGRVRDLERQVAARDAEIARLKGLKGRPEIKPSGMEQATNAPSVPAAGPRRGGGNKTARRTVHEERVVKAAAPPGSARHLAALPRSLHAQRHRPCGEDPAPHRLSLGRYCLCPGRRTRSPCPVAPQWRNVADQLRPKVPRLATLMDAAEADVLAYMDFPREHRAKIHSTNPIERLNGEIKRRTDVVGIFPNADAVVRLVGAILLEQSDEWTTQRARYMTLETIGPISNAATVSLPAMAD